MGDPRNHFRGNDCVRVPAILKLVLPDHHWNTLRSPTKCRRQTPESLDHGGVLGEIVRLDLRNIQNP